MQIRLLARLGMVCAFLIAACSFVSAQDVAAAARAAKAKKQQTQTDASKKTAEPKVYTNDEIPEAKSSSAQSPSGQTAQQTGNSTANPSHGTGSTPAAASAGHVEVSLSKNGFKRPGSTEIHWLAKNTSDHFAKFQLATVITGPCNYHDQKSSSFDLAPGSGLTDNMLSFVAYESNCAGTYMIELRLSSGGNQLDSASATVPVD